MLEVKVTVTLAPEVLTLLADIVGGLSQGDKPVKKTGSSGKVVDYHKKSKKAKPTETESVESEDSVTVDDLRALAKKLVTSPNTKEKLKALLSDKGIKKIVDAEEDDYTELYEQMTAMAGG